MSAAAATLHARNRRVGLMMLGLVAAMVGLGFASVPLYRLFCQATGFNGTTQRTASEQAQAPGAVVGRIVSVRFDGNVSPKLPWRFGPERETMRVAVGARELAFFDATNDSDKPVTGRAVFNVSPGNAGQYFTKIQCFCFTEQTLKPHETVRMPVTFFLDPAMLKDPDASNLDEITLSYTFYPVTNFPVTGAGSPS